MAGKLDVYNLGALGVNLVQSPVHVKDGDLLQCQNAMPTPIEGQLALTKRPGMTQLASLGGTVLSITNIPFAAPTGPEPGIDWLVVNGAPDETWNDIIWVPSLELFAAVGEGAFMTSPDGLNWTDHSDDIPNGVWRGLAYSEPLGIYCVIGTSSGGGKVVILSPDGINWTQHTCNIHDGAKVIWSDDDALFIAVGGNFDNPTAKIRTSPDGETWTEPTTDFGGKVNAVLYAPSLNVYLGTGQSGSLSPPFYEVIKSTNSAANWAKQDNTGGVFFNSVGWSEELAKFVLVGAQSPPVLWVGDQAPDQGEWTEQAGPEQSWEDVVGTPTLFVAVSSNGAPQQVMTSPDAINWTLRDTPTDATWEAVAYSPTLDRYVSVARSGDVMRSG